MESKEYCKLCLVTDVKLFCLGIPSLSEAYLQLMQIPLLTAQGFVCFECTSLLRKFMEFYTKCSNANILLSYLHQDHSKITKQMVQGVDRTLHKLESKLAKSKLLTFDKRIFFNNKDESDHKVHGIKIEIKTELNEEGNDSFGNGLAEALITEVPPVATACENTVKRNTMKRKNTKTKIATKPKKQKSSTAGILIKNESSHNDNDAISDNDIPLSEVKKSVDEVTTKALNVVKKVTINKKRVEESNKTKSARRIQGFDKNYMTIIKLTIEKAKEEMLLRKESTNYRNCEFKCELCFRGYDTKITYDNHMKKHEMIHGAFECDICHLRYSERALMVKHKYSHHTRKFICKICPYTCLGSIQAKSHMDVHKGKKYICKDCYQVFSMRHTLLMHQRNKHKAEIVCDICGSVFTGEKGRDSHKRLLHSNEKNEQKGPKCEECNIQFSTEMAWKRHLVLSTKHIVSNGCEQCGERFPDKKALRKHAKEHPRVRYTVSGKNTAPVFPASCALCDLWITTRGMYKAHMTSQHPEAATKLAAADADAMKKFMCDVCGKAFKHQCILDDHKRVHTGEKPYKCEECDRTYYSQGALSNHRTIHRPGSQPKLPCHLCDKVLSNRSALTKHIKVAHLNFRPHKCGICEKKFANPCEVKYHMRHVHENMPWPKRDRSKRSK